MNEGTPKLYANKPKKAQMKLAQPSPPPASSSPAASAAAASYSMGTPAQNHPPPPPPQSNPPPPPGKESFARRYKFMWPVLLTVNLAVGAYLFMRTSKKDTEMAEEEEESKVALAPPASSSVPSTASMADKSPSTTPVVQPVINREPIPPSQQHELFKWMLEEKRKIKPKDAEERKRIDEEKAILKQFLRTCFKRGEEVSISWPRRK